MSNNIFAPAHPSVTHIGAHSPLINGHSGALSAHHESQLLFTNNSREPEFKGFVGSNNTNTTLFSSDPLPPLYTLQQQALKALNVTSLPYAAQSNDDGAVSGSIKTPVIFLAATQTGSSSDYGGETISVTAPPSTPTIPPSSAAPGSNTMPPQGNGNNAEGGGTSSSNTNPVTVPTDSASLKLILSTPTGKQEYDKLISDGWKFQYTSNSQSYTDYPDKVVLVSNRWEDAPNLAASQIAHEMGHALNYTIPNTSSRDAFVNSELFGEGQATANNIKISIEAGDANIPISGSPNLINTYIAEYNDGIRGSDMSIAYREIASTYGSSEITGSGVPYYQYYANYWDQGHDNGWW